MTTTAAKILTGLFARITPSGQSVGGKPTIGSSGPTTKDYPLANIVSAFKVVAAASSNVATLTLSTGVVAQTTGSPVITDGDGKDLEGVTLPTLANIQGIRIRTGAGNTGTVVVGGSSNSKLPAITLDNDADVAVGLKAAGVALSGATLTFTFSAASDTVIVEYLGKSA
jgi:hypothetical protein